MAKRVKHHGFAHLILFVVLFLLGAWAFGGWTAGPVTSGLRVGTDAYAAVVTGTSGDVEATSAAAGGTLLFLLSFIANLIIYYLTSVLVIFLFNLFFGGEKKNG